MTDYIEGVAYLTVRRDVRRAKGLRPVKVTHRMPDTVDFPGDRVLKLKLRIPSEVFLPLETTVDVEIENVRQLVAVTAE